MLPEPRDSRSPRLAIAYLHALALLLVFSPWLVNDRPYVVRGTSQVALERRLEILAEAVDESDERDVEGAARDLIAGLAEGHEAREALRACFLEEREARLRCLREWLFLHRPRRAVISLLDGLIDSLDVLRGAAHVLLHLPPTPDQWRSLEDSLEALDTLLERIEGGSSALARDVRRALDLVRTAREDLDERRIDELLERRGADFAPLIAHLEAFFARGTEEREAFLLEIGVRGRTLAPRVVTEWPLAQSLTPFEIGCMFAGLVDVAFLLARRRAPRWKVRWAWIGSAAIAGSFLALWVPRPHDVTHHRTEILAGRFEVEYAFLPPVPWSYDLSHGERPLAPPSWWEEMPEQRAEGEVSRDPAGPRTASSRHWLGTDEHGRDVLARLVYGGRFSLGIALLAAGLTTALGILASLLALVHRPFDWLVRAWIEILLCFPTVLVVLASVMIAKGYLGSHPGTLEIVLAIACVLASFRFTQLARLLRFEFARIVHMPFVEAARSLGARPWRIATRNVLPHAMTPILVFLAFEVAVAAIFESSLAFLGFGLPEPLPSWGHLLRSASASPSSWWLVVFPTVALVSTLVALNSLSDALQVGLDPRRRPR